MGSRFLLNLSSEVGCYINTKTEGGGEDENMMILCLLKVHPNASDSKNMPSPLDIPVPEGIKVHGMYLLFGQYDIAIWYEAPDAETAAEYLMGSEIAPYVKIERSLAIPLKRR